MQRDLQLFRSLVVLTTAGLGVQVLMIRELSNLDSSVKGYRKFLLDDGRGDVIGGFRYLTFLIKEDSLSC